MGDYNRVSRGYEVDLLSRKGHQVATPQALDSRAEDLAAYPKP